MLALAADPRKQAACPACGSARFQPTQSKATRMAQRVLAQQPFLGPVGRKCADCGWQVD